MTKYFRNSRNFFFISLFLLLALQLIILWSSPTQIQTRIASNISSKIQEYESDIELFLEDQFIDTLCVDNSLLKRNLYWERFINKTKDKSYSVLIYNSNNIRFWSKSKIIPDCDYLELKDGNNFRMLDNGWYIIRQKSIQDSKVLILINIKNQYGYQNEYLKNNYSKNFDIPDYVNIELLSNQNGEVITDSNGQKLFRIVVDDESLNSSPSYIQLLLWILIFIFSYLCVNSFVKHLWYKGESLAAFLFLIFSILLFRTVTMYWSIPESIYKLPFFSPDIYASNFLFPSLGDLILNLLMIHWVVYFLFDKIKELNFRIYNVKVSYILTFVFVISSYFFLDIISYVFEGLVMNSNISFDLTNILSLNFYSVSGFFVLALMLYSFYLYNDTLIGVFHQFFLSKREKLNVFVIAIVLVFLVKSLLAKPDILFYSNTIFIILIERAKNKKREYLNLPLVVLILTIFAFSSASRLSDFISEKEKQNRQLLASKLESANDPIAEYLLEGLVKKIVNDKVVKSFFESNEITNESLDTRIQQLYFGGYFSKYDLNVYEFDDQGKSIKQTYNRDIEYFDDIINNQCTPTFNSYFYYQSNTYGILTYYGKIPITLNNKNVGYLLIELKSKYFRDENIFPELLLEGGLKMNKDFKYYSYSIYKQGKLISQQGAYPYSLTDLEFNTSNEGYTFINTNSYDHLVYKPSKEIVIVVSKQEDSILKLFAVFSYLFGLFSFFLLIFYTRRLLGKRFNLITINWNIFTWKFRFLFKTRIQVSLIFTIIFSLSIVAYITFIYISDQYSKQQNERLSQKVRSILISLEKKSNVINYWTAKYDDKMSIELKALSDQYLTDINIYNLDGRLLISTQPKIFDEGLTSRYMNPDAYLMMKRYEKSEFSKNEKIGALNFLSVYAPIRDINNKIVGYLNLPYFANKLEYENRVSQFFTTFINVYVFVFVIIGFIAFFIANSITYPLTLIEEQLRETKIGKKMDAIDWKGRDEIGRLIKEYNRMIHELEESTERLAKSERENAWREMAKQVAHEIKNPLTPMKLGLQLLQRSWLDNDPEFRDKFERFSKTMIQQIESLSLIASEFSNFAQMPQTQLEQVDIKDIIINVVDLYKNENDIEISLGYNPSLRSVIYADKDQMIRVFNNLIKNSIQAIPSQRIGKIDVELMNDKDSILVIIQDNGVGIDEDMREKIFRPNFTTKGSGMGMGLAIVNSIIINAEGKIWFNSSLNKGTTFYVSLPLTNK